MTIAKLEAHGMQTLWGKSLHWAVTQQQAAALLNIPY
jgi:hypothetical protein